MIKNYKIMACWLLLAIYLVLFSQGYLEFLDAMMYNFLSLCHHPMMTQVVIFITSLGAWYSIILIGIITCVIDKRKGIIMASNIALIYLLNNIIKVIVMRQRPLVLHLVEETSFSFPSGHSMVSFAVYGLIAYYLYKKHRLLSVFVMMIPICIGLTRIYLGVHYATDVIGGFLFSFTWLCTMIPLLKNHKILSDS